MNNFQTEDGKRLLSYLQENLGAEVVSKNQCLAHLKMDQKDPHRVKQTKSLTKAERVYPLLFTEKFLLLFEYPEEERETKFVVYSLSWDRRKELIRQFGGREIINFWCLDNVAGGPFGYKGNKMPEASEITEFLEKL